MSTEYTIVRHQYMGDKFEILVDPDKGLAYKRGEIEEVSTVLMIDTIFSDANKGEKPSLEKLIEVYGTSDPIEVAKQIFEKGVFQLNTKQRREILDQKLKQIINIISKSYVDPSTKLPHPPKRIENALTEIRVNVDLIKDAEEQVKDIVNQLRPILPMSSESIRLAIKIPAEFTGKSYGIVKNYAEIKREEWQSDGSWIAILEIPAAIQIEMLESLGKATQGNIQSKIL